MRTEVTDAQVHKAIKVILDDKKAYGGSLNWAVNYCLLSREMHGEALRVQCLYILGNISHWRHPLAKTVREVLRSYTKQE